MFLKHQLAFGPNMSIGISHPSWRARPGVDMTAQEREREGTDTGFKEQESGGFVLPLTTPARASLKVEITSFNTGDYPAQSSIPK